MGKKYDVIALGELLIDFTMNGKSEQGNNMFEACPGGAPCNVLALLSKMGRKTAFVGKVGKDQFGTLLRETIREAGIDESHLVEDEEVNTTLAFVHTFPDGDREFSFYRNPGADMMLNVDEVDADFIKNTKIIILSTIIVHLFLKKSGRMVNIKFLCCSMNSSILILLSTVYIILFDNSTKNNSPSHTVTV